MLKDTDLADDTKIKATKSLGIVRLNKQNMQIVYGVQVHLIKAELDKIL